MITHRSAPWSRFYVTISIALSIALVCSLIPTEGWGLLFGVSTVHAALASPSATSPINVPGGANVNPPMTQGLWNALPVELADRLTKAGAIGPDGQPNGMLIDIEALQSDIQHEPITLANPVSISRVQSAYCAADAVSSTVVITFVVTNNLPPAVKPQSSVSSTITNAVTAVSAIDFSKDPNVIHNVLIADSLTGYATFVSSFPVPDRSLYQYAWNLGDVLPSDSVTATLAVSVPTTVAGFIDLDTGATAWGTLQDHMVSAQARPASLVPDTINGELTGDWLKWTVDADKYDQYMLRQAIELGQNPLRMFEYVRSLGYESYRGSLRGTRGTLWSEAGNSMDKASLLIAMLRASGIPSRYRHGTLSKERAQELLVSAFAPYGRE